MNDPTSTTMGALQKSTDDTAEEQAGPDLLSDCRLMLKFARREARSIPVELTTDIARLDMILKGFGLQPISTIPTELIVENQNLFSDGASPLSTTELILKVHAALSQVVAPATALSLQVSEPAPGKHRFLGGMPLIVKAAAWMAIACAIGFVMTSIPAAKDKFQNLGEKPSPSPAVSASATPSPSPKEKR